MAASVVLVPERLSIEPGTEGQVTVRVRNSGTVVDEVSLAVVGDAAAWATIDPPSLNLFPGAEGQAQLVFRPPRSSAVPAGATPFGVLARSQEDPASSAVEEGTVDVAPFSELGASLVPQTTETSGRARTRLTVTNAGNTIESIGLTIEDPDAALASTVQPNALYLAPGQTQQALVTLKPRNRFLRGPTRPRTYSVLATSATGEPLRTPGTLMQKAVIGAGWVKAAMAIAAVAIALVVLQATSGGKNKPLVADIAGSSDSTQAKADDEGAGGDDTSTSMDTTTTTEVENRDILHSSTREGPDSDIWSVRPGGGGRSPITDDSVGDFDPAWSPDGKKIAYISDEDGDNEVFVMNADGSGRKQLTNNDVDDRGPTWSPDGKRIAWASSPNEFQIFVMNANGSGEKQISDPDKVLQARDPDWSPDGKKIAFTALRDLDNAEIGVMNPDGSGFAFVTNTGAQEGNPAWNPDGSMLAIERAAGTGKPDVAVMKPNGTGVTTLTSDAAFDGAPAWSPDGTQIAFASERQIVGGGRRIWVMDADGGGETNVTRDDGDTPDW